MRHTALPAGGGEAALARVVGHAHAIRLDRSRPLWELWVIEGLGDDRVALYSKVHVAAIDDSTGAELMTALLDTDPAGRPAVPPSEPLPGAVDGAPGPLDVVGRLVGPLPDQVRWAAGFPGRLAERALRAAGEQWPGLRETVVEVTQRTPVLGAVANLLPTSDAGDVFDEHPTGRAPRLSFNAPITPHRRFALARLPIDDVLAVKHAAGTTFNDVVVAVCAGALRRWLLAHDELPTSPTVAMVPVLVAGSSGRREDAHVAGLIAALPTHVAEPSRAPRPHPRRAGGGQGAPRRRPGVAAAGHVDVRPAGRGRDGRPARRRPALPVVRQPDRQPGDHQRARTAPAGPPRRAAAGVEPPGACRSTT